MYEIYQLGQAWARLWVKAAEPAFNNPIADWYMDQYTETMLRCWFWPGALVALEDQYKQMLEIFTAGNICRPQ